MVVMTVLVCLFLVFGGNIADTWSAVGAFGLLGIVYGMLCLPNSAGFILMAGGGVLLVVYGFVVEAWVFFLLNIFFAVSNIVMWHKSKK